MRLGGRAHCLHSLLHTPLFLDRISSASAPDLQAPSDAFAQVYAILTNADNSKVIRSINNVRKHRMVSDTGSVQAATAQHDICGGPKIARLEFTLDINFTFFPQTYSGKFELDTPAGMRLYKVRFPSDLPRPWS